MRKHSRKQLEIKLLYPLREKGMSRYMLDCYFFFPPHLHVTEKRVGIDGILSNIHIYTRFSSPLIPLEKVIDQDFELSPLIRIENLLDKVKGGGRDLDMTIIYELQTLCNLYRAEIRNFVDLMKKEMRANGLSQIYSDRISDMAAIIGKLLVRFRRLHKEFLDPHLDDRLRTALRWADESISITTTTGFTRLFGYCRFKEDEQIMSLIGEIVRDEEKYRSSMNYLYLFNEEDPHCGETMAYRESMLKKWSQSAMYMNSEYSRAPGRVGHLIAGSAAGLAMFFAVFAAIFARNISPQYSSLWILVMVISYIMKDRIKDILKGIFGNIFAGLTTDQQINLYDPAMKTRVGRSSGTIRFTSPSNIPRDVREMRFSRLNPFRAIIPPNTVVYYRKNIKVKSDVLLQNHSRLESITEVIRFQIDNWLKEMDDPQETLFRLEGEKLERIQGNRVYRVHLIVRLDETLYHYLLVLNKSGIVRIENR